MLFSSLTFLFGFLPILIILYSLIRKRKFKNFILLIFSLIFYAWGEPKYIFLMLITTFVVYLFGLVIDKLDNSGKHLEKKVVFITSVIIVIGSLIFFKYSNSYDNDSLPLAKNLLIITLNINTPTNTNIYSNIIFILFFPPKEKTPPVLGAFLRGTILVFYLIR